MIPGEMLKKILMLQGNVPCARQVNMLLVLDKCELPPLHLAGEAIKDVEVQIMNTERRFVTQTCLIENINIYRKKW